MKVVVLFSGGLDSTVLLYHLRAEEHEVKALSADYGQRHHARELNAGKAICRQLGVERRVVDLTGLTWFFGSNALTDDDRQLPEGAYSAATLPLTTVPNRNMVLLAVGIAWAASLQFDAVAFGAHGGVHTNYPDCRPEFADAMDRAAQLCDHRSLRVLAPFATWVKADVVRRGAELDVPFGLTWSCYAGGETPCGKCGTCVDRIDAFAACRLSDPVN